MSHKLVLNRRQMLASAAVATGAAVFSPNAMNRCLGATDESPAGFKYAICNETFGDWPFERVCDFSASCGYTGVEIAPFTIAGLATDVSAAQRAELRRQAQRAGLDVVGLHWLLAKTEGFHLTTPEAEVRRRTTNYLGELARFCADLGGKLMIFGSPQQRNLVPGVSREQGMKHAAEVLQAVVPTLEKTGVTLAIEPLAPRETNFITTAADAVRLSEMVGSTHCRMMLDCKAMSSESTPMPELIERNRRLLTHFHANDPNLRGPGFGDLDFVPLLRALWKIDYRGWVSVEVFDYTPGPERLARESIAYLRKCAAKVEAS